VKPSPDTVEALKATPPPTLEAIDAFVADFRVGGYAGNEDELFVAELLLREALLNAVEHGCQGRPLGCIHCAVRWRSKRLTIAVSDDGDGFDWHAAWNRLADPLGSSGRGIGILRKYASAVRFNKKGNTVTILKRF
jgi:anti-sigma regulatory factor (Ser/Thr protein kinase)